MNEDEMATDKATKAGGKTKRRKPKLKNLMLRDGVYYFKKTVRGKREFNGRKTPFSLETSDEGVAIAKRDAFLRAADGAEVDRVLGRGVKPVALLTEIEEAYKAADKPRRETRNANLACLKRVCRLAGLSWGTARAEDLKREVVERFQNATVAGARAKGHKEDSEEVAAAKFGADRTLALARSVFAYERPYRHLHLPRPDGFLDADTLDPQRDARYTPMSREERALFAAELFELRAQMLGPEGEARTRATGIFALWLCMRYLGMRNNEAEFCRPAEWIVRAGDGWVMRICDRPERKKGNVVITPGYYTKAAGSTRDLPVADWLREELMALSAGREWLIPGRHTTDRHDICHRSLNEWMGEIYERAIEAKILPAETRPRTAYDWRKQAGSEVYHQTRDILATSKWMGHTSVHTTTRWYVGLIQALPSLA